MSGAHVAEIVCPQVEVEISARRIEEYADAIGDPNPRYRRKGRDASHVVAPRALAAAYLQEPVRALVRDADLVERVGVDFRRVVFGEVEYRYHALVRPDAWITATGRLVDRFPKGDKEILVFATEARLDDGTLVAESTITLVRR